MKIMLLGIFGFSVGMILGFLFALATQKPEQCMMGFYVAQGNTTQLALDDVRLCGRGMYWTRRDVNGEKIGKEFR